MSTARHAARRASALAAFALIMMLALLLGYGHLVRLAVQQGDEARAARAARSDALWRCNALRAMRLRDDCRLALS